jgi:hypothetical protein
MSAYWKGFLISVVVYLAGRFVVDTWTLSASWAYFIAFVLGGCVEVIRMELEKAEKS